jgi:hypothetical protein
MMTVTIFYDKSFVQGGKAAVIAHATSNVGFQDSTLRGGNVVK